MTGIPSVPGDGQGHSRSLGANDPRIRRALAARVQKDRAREAELRRLVGEQVPATATLAELIAAHNRAVQALTEGN